MNLGEQLSIARINHEREMVATADSPRAESIAEAVVMSRAAGVSQDEFARALERVDVGPTLTAHPTEARRRTVITKQLEIAEWARQMIRSGSAVELGLLRPDAVDLLTRAPEWLWGAKVWVLLVLETWARKYTGRQDTES